MYLHSQGTCSIDSNIINYQLNSLLKSNKLKFFLSFYKWKKIKLFELKADLEIPSIVKKVVGNKNQKLITR